MSATRMLMEWWRLLLPYSEQEQLERERAIWDLEHADTVPAPPPTRQAAQHGAPEGSEW